MSELPNPPIDPARPFEEEAYPRAEVASMVARYRERIEHMADLHPELSIVHDDFEEIVHHDADPLRELGALLTACEQTFVGLKHLLNPTGLPLHMSDDGRILTRTFEGVATFLTDIRGFTELTRNASERWGLPIFDLLSYCYFPYLADVLEGYGCHYLNYTGDGLLVLSRDVVDEAGRLVLPCLDNAVLCALDLTLVTNGIAEAWRQQGMTRPDGTPHETGLGLTFGDVLVGDPFVPDRAYTGPSAEFDAILRAILAEIAPHIRPTLDFSHRVRAIHALSPTINRASRLQDMDKMAPAHTIMMTDQDVARLCPPLRERFHQIGEMALKGIGLADVYGVLRHDPVDVPALAARCRAHYAEGPGPGPA